MKRFKPNAFTFVCLTFAGLALTTAGLTRAMNSESSAPQQSSENAAGHDHDMNMDMDMDMGHDKAHEDHYPRHGGIFFMAMDNVHHLEGTFERPGIFRVYLYNVYVKPLPGRKVKEAKGTVQVGDSEDAPKLPLVVSKDGKTLEIDLGKEVKLPTTITLLMHFPDTPANARPELFTFPITHYVDPNLHTGKPEASSMPTDMHMHD